MKAPFIAEGITLRHRVTGAHYKIESLHGHTIKLRDTEDTHDSVVVGENVGQVFEEFGPLYELPRIGMPGWPEVRLERCPFCGSTHLDPASWMSDADVNNTGPGCMDCGATSESVELWNKRYEAPAQILDWDGLMHMHASLLVTDPANVNVGQLRKLLVRVQTYADEINHLRNVIQSACIGGMVAMAHRWAQLFPDAGPLPDSFTPASTDWRVAKIMDAADEFGHVFAFVGDDTMSKYRKALEDLVRNHLEPMAPVGELTITDGSMTLGLQDGLDCRSGAFDLYHRGVTPLKVQRPTDADIAGENQASTDMQHAGPEDARYFVTLAEAVLNPNSDTAAWLMAAGKPATVDDLRKLLADAASRSVVVAPAGVVGPADC